MADGGQLPAGADGSGVNASLTTAKESRKRAELDAQLLANRIALLKQEEEKAWKKIEETRKRAGEVMGLRVQNESKFAAKEQFYKDKWESIRGAQVQNSKQRERAFAARDQAREGLAQSRNTNAAQSKQISQQMLVQKKEREANERQTNQDRSAYLKQRKEEAKRKLEEDRLQQLNQFREDYEARIGQEELLRARTDALVARMEKEEMELIQRLQNTQTVQRSAYEELESALGTTAQQISSSKGANGQAALPRPAA